MITQQTVSPSQPTPSYGAFGPGTQLRHAREALRVSDIAMAEHLKLSVETLARIEHDEFFVENLPPSIFIQGYLRSYAHAVQIPAQPIIDQYQQLLIAQGNQTVNQPASEHDLLTPAKLMQMSASRSEKSPSSIISSKPFWIVMGISMLSVIGLGVFL